VFGSVAVTDTAVLVTCVVGFGVHVGHEVMFVNELFTCTVTSPVVFPALLVTVTRSTYVPVAPNVTVLEVAAGVPNVTVPGPDNFVHA
jgi:hypothetical protein